MARGGEDFHLVAQVDFILLKHLEGLTDASRPHFEVKVFFVAVESLLDETRERHAVFDPHPFGMVDFHQDFVTIDRQVGEEIILSSSHWSISCCTTVLLIIQWAIIAVV